MSTKNKTSAVYSSSADNHQKTFFTNVKNTFFCEVEKKNVGGSSFSMMPVFCAVATQKLNIHLNSSYCY